jgi:hypothetical protein
VDFQERANHYSSDAKPSFAAGAARHRTLQQKSGSASRITFQVRRHGREKLPGESELAARLPNPIGGLHFLPGLGRGSLLRRRFLVRPSRDRESSQIKNQDRQEIKSHNGYHFTSSIVREIGRSDFAAQLRQPRGELRQRKDREHWDGFEQVRRRNHRRILLLGRIARQSQREPE